MVDLQRGVQSYLIAKSSLEQDGYEQAPDTVRRPSQSRDPEGIPIAAVATTKNLESQEMFQGGGANFLPKDWRWLIRRCRLIPARGAAPPSAAPSRPPSGRLRPRPASRSRPAPRRGTGSALRAPAAPCRVPPALSLPASRAWRAPSPLPLLPCGA